ncbi:hypothetical protein [Fodinibius saliphilus]|uniref:hypothetical protein n=1 Tax=Fodinibius saliphilus TaxID=1920650 RepID=UPI0011096CA7|nr:hypothetical protein [Fodinibius saliphilus]
MKVSKIALFLFLAFAIHVDSNAQEINFGDYGNYTLTVGELNNNDLEYGQIISGSGLHSIDINNAKVLTISGVQYLDVIVEVTGANSLYLNGNPGHTGDSQKSIPFTLKAAYANSKGTPTIGQAKFITSITNNSFIKQFPILERQHQPPGPPPTPPTNAFDQSQVEETAYLYLYGDINVGNVDAGNYSSTIDVTVNYD